MRSVVAGAVAALLLAGCGTSTASPSATGGDAGTPLASPAPVTEPSPSASVASACKDVMAALPNTVAGQARTATTTWTASWGNPAVTLRCGVPKPTGLAPDSTCNEVNGVGWYAEQTTAGYTFTTIGRRGYVEVRVPSSVQPAADALVDLTSAVKHMPVVTPCQ